jgi:hypothetical protein
LAQEAALTEIVRHECGHLIAAKCLNFKTGMIQVEALEARAEIALMPSCQDIAELRSYLIRRIKVLYAGVCAQCLNGNSVDGRRAIELLKSTARDDAGKSRELLRVFCATENWGPIDEESYSEKIQRVEDDLSTRALELVESEAAIIHSLTRWIMDKVKAEKSIREAVFGFTIPGNEIDAFDGIFARFG